MITDCRGRTGLRERLQQLGGQPDPDHRVHHRLPDPQPGVPRHHHLWPGDITMVTLTPIMWILLAPTGAQGVTMGFRPSVCPSVTKCYFFIFLA